MVNGYSASNPGSKGRSSNTSVRDLKCSGSFSSICALSSQHPVGDRVKRDYLIRQPFEDILQPQRQLRVEDPTVFSNSLTEKWCPVPWKERSILLGGPDKVVGMDLFWCSRPLSEISMCLAPSEKSPYRLSVLIPEAEVLCFESDFAEVRCHKVLGIARVDNLSDLSPILIQHRLDHQKY
jgi:hypothetical protein